MYSTAATVVGLSGFLWASTIGTGLGAYARLNSGPINPGDMKKKGILLLAGQVAAATYMYYMWDSGALTCLGGTAGITAVATFIATK